MLTRGSTSLRTALTALSLCAALTLAGCSSGTEDKPPKKTNAPSAPKEEPRPGDHKVTFTWDGKKRTYTVHAPPGYTPGKQLPLVITMHPYPSDGTFVTMLSGMSEKADKENFLVAYPDGIDGGLNALSCCGNEDDIGFIRTLTKRLVETWNADPERIYATGISNGGDMSFKLAVELSDTFAAIAPVSGGYTGGDTDEATYLPKSPVSVITFIGGGDQYYPPFNAGIKTWQKRLKCKAGEPKKLKQQITRTTAECADGSDVVAYRLPDMGHHWPGGQGDMAYRDSHISATDLMWKFFAAHPKQTS
ncbi:PHB depolymerase family esterase [Streptomyces sp. T-3]|nr:PHB depolymerase family esterase [Streptomyces sp. T-3]